MTLQELRYFAAVAEHLHFGRAAEACFASQPTLSGQIRNLEEQLGVRLFERTNKRVALTAAGERILPHAQRALEEARFIETLGKAGADELSGPFKLGVIPTLAPYLMPRLLWLFREAYPNLNIELWEDLTRALVDLLRSQRLDAILIATDISDAALVSVPLFEESFLAALPKEHTLAKRKRIAETDLKDDLLVLADGHCLAGQALAACGGARGSFQASSLETVVNMVASGYGTTLVPRLAAANFRDRNVVLLPLAGNASRTVRMASRKTFPRQKTLAAVAQMVERAGQTAAKTAKLKV